jgi:DNA-binding NtrC family response regulator
LPEHTFLCRYRSHPGLICWHPGTRIAWPGKQIWSEATKSQQHKEIPEFSDEAIFYLLKYHWPGNVRQLENVLLCAVTANRDGIIKPDDFPLEIMEACTHNNSTTDKTSVELTSIPGSLSLKEMEKIAIIQALQQVNFNITQAARILGMSKSTLYRKINAYNLLESIRSDN